MSIYLPSIIKDLVDHGFQVIKIEIDEIKLVILANCMEKKHQYFMSFIEIKDDLSGGFIYTIIFICDGQSIMYEKSYSKRETKYLLRKGFNLLWDKITQK